MWQELGVFWRVKESTTTEERYLILCVALHSDNDDGAIDTTRLYWDK